jgi:hypothetical protein
MSLLPLLFILSIVLTQTNALGEVFVSTTRGLVQGWHVDNGMNQSQIYYGSADVFLGIPYVQPPVGSLRFKVSLENMIQSIIQSMDKRKHKLLT